MYALKIKGTDHVLTIGTASACFRYLLKEAGAVTLATAMKLYVITK